MPTRAELAAAAAAAARCIPIPAEWGMLMPTIQSAHINYNADGIATDKTILANVVDSMGVIRGRIAISYNIASGATCKHGESTVLLTADDAQRAANAAAALLDPALLKAAIDVAAATIIVGGT